MMLTTVIDKAVASFEFLPVSAIVMGEEESEERKSGGLYFMYMCER